MRTPPTRPTALASSPAALADGAASSRMVMEYPGPGTGIAPSYASLLLRRGKSLVPDLGWIEPDSAVPDTERKSSSAKRIQRLILVTGCR
nr:hypothetical protein GCM10020241_30950 [Streptoalloteichus tenebrarius]